MSSTSRSRAGTEPLEHENSAEPRRRRAAATESPEETILCYDTAERVSAMRRCEAEVEEIFSCCVRMRLSDGSRIWIGSPATTSEVLSFLPTLEEGRNYTFPDAFLAWQDRQHP